MKERTYIINGNEYKVTVNSVSGDKANVTVNGTSYDVQIKDAAPASAPAPAATAPRSTFFFSKTGLPFCV